MNERIKTVRAFLNLSQSEFGKRLGLSQNYIWMIEKGQRDPSDRTVSDICREFGVSEQWLRQGVGEMLVPRTRSEELAEFFASVLRDRPDAFRTRFIAALADLPVGAWEKIEEFALRLAEQQPEEEEEQT